jgi:hypothetical protein
MINRGNRHRLGVELAVKATEISRSDLLSGAQRDQRHTSTALRAD